MKMTLAIAEAAGRARSPLRAAAGRRSARTECAPYLRAMLLGALLFPALAVHAGTNDLTSAIQRGLFEEEANQNLGAAIQAYQTVANQFDKDRKLAATAIFRLGECYRKQGNTNEAAGQYERILREFSDQPTLVTLSRQNLATLGSAPAAAPAAPVLSDAARQEQKRLLEEEIKLVQKQLESQQKQVQVGAAPSDSVLPTERDLLRLKRQAAALDAGQPISFAATEASAAATPTESDEVKRIQALIKDSPDLINAPDRWGETLLQSAAAKGKLAVVKLLLDSGAAVDGFRQPGLTALHYAAANGHKAVVDLLLSKGAKADARNDAGVTPLHLAARKGYESVVKTLLAAGAPVNAAPKDLGNSDTEDLQYRISVGQTPLHLAASAGYAGLVELLLAKGAEVNAVDTFGRTPLSYAERYQPVVQLLLAAHANPNAGASDLPLTLAAYYGDLPALKLLLASGADPNANTNLSVNFFTGVNGRPTGSGGNATPLAAAVSRQHPDAVAELIRAKADPNGVASDGVPLIFGALGDAPTLKALLEGGADPNRLMPERPPNGLPPSGQESGVTPLYQAVAQAKLPALELLLAHHADVNCTNKQGGTPLQLAAATGSRGIAEVLLKAGANVNAKANDGWTALHEAVARDQREMVDFLLAHNADPNERNNAGQTPLDVAKEKARQPQAPQPGMMPGTMADLLRRHGALDDLPHLDQISARRSATGFSTIAFTKAPQDWSQFTLLELLAVEYKLLAPSPDTGGASPSGVTSVFGNSRLSFPDLAHLHISRLTADLKRWQDQVADLSPVMESGECAKDLRLRWGDLVEIPEADHPLNEKWAGFSRTELTNLIKCLTRKVEIVVKGQATTITLAPKITGLEGLEGATAVLVPAHGPGFAQSWEPTIFTYTPYWLRPVLLQSKLVLVSSDLSRVKVTRRDPATGQKREWVVDCSDPRQAPSLWLQDGDRIEVPEKSYASAAQPEMPEAAAPGMTPPSSPGQSSPHFSQRLQNIIQRAPSSSPESAVPPPGPAERMQRGIVQLPAGVPRLPAAGPVGKPALFQALPDATTFKALLEGGADPNVRTSDGRPLLVQAVRDKNQVAVELLLSHQADVNAADSDGWTPLDYATADGLKAIVELLLKAGATVNARNPSGETPLHIAVRGGQRELAELLLAHKADPNVRNNAGQTPLALAQSMGLSLGMGGAGSLAPASETPQAVEDEYLTIGGVLYSPKPDDPSC